MESLSDRYQKGWAIRSWMASDIPIHYNLVGLTPDLKRIIEEALFGPVWTRPDLDRR